MRTDQRGMALFESIVAATFVALVVVSISYSFTKMSKSTLQNRDREIAANLAHSHLQRMKAQPYAFMPTSDIYPPEAPLGHFNADCDCRTINWDVLSATTTVVSGLAFLVRSCLNYVSPPPPSVNGPWVASCADMGPGDTGYKQVIVRTTWLRGGQTGVLRTEALLMDN